MGFTGLEENDEIWEPQHPGDLEELLRRRNGLGRDISVFKLMAALHTMELHICLQIINKLVAEGILGRHAETSQ